MRGRRQGLRFGQGVHARLHAELAGGAEHNGCGREAGVQGSGETLRTDRTVRGVLLRHLELEARYQHDPIGPLRRIICWYFKEFPGVAAFRQRVNQASSLEQMRELRRMLDQTHAAWSRDGERLKLYHSSLIPRARENSEAALSARVSKYWIRSLHWVGLIT